MKIYINNHYCPQAVAEDLFGDLLPKCDLYNYRITKILCWNNVVYKLMLINPYTQELYFEIDE